jgi:carboxylesterase type B
LLSLANANISALVKVFVWIYGGGYTSGTKSGPVSGHNGPGGLFRRGGDDFVYVAINYRLGAFGFLNSKKDGVANLGLHDQRFALDWVQEYIHLFGGDAARVTVAGESGGGGSILHHITAFGGSKNQNPFQRAILQSPAFLPTSVQSEKAILNRFLSLLNVTSLEEARKLPSAALIDANFKQIVYESVNGSFTYGPSVDGDLVPKPPLQLLAEGHFNHNISAMVSHNQLDGLIFSHFPTSNDTVFTDTLQSLLPFLTLPMLENLSNDLYPPIFDGSQGYADQVLRLSTTVQDLVFECNELALTYALQNQTYSYVFSVPPAIHGIDVAYTFYDDGGNSSSLVDPSIAMTMQRLFTSFLSTGKPNSPSEIEFPVYGKEGNILNLNITGPTIINENPLQVKRCNWWQKLSY